MSPILLSPRASPILAHIQTPPDPPRDSRVGAPLTYSQQSLWFAQELDPSRVDYVVHFAMRLRTRVLSQCFRNAVQDLVDRHASFRTTYQSVAGVPRQILHCKIASKGPKKKQKQKPTTPAKVSKRQITRPPEVSPAVWATLTTEVGFNRTRGDSPILHNCVHLRLVWAFLLFKKQCVQVLKQHSLHTTGTGRSFSDFDSQT